MVPYNGLQCGPRLFPHGSTSCACHFKCFSHRETTGFHKVFPPGGHFCTLWPNLDRRTFFLFKAFLYAFTGLVERAVWRYRPLCLTIRMLKQWTLEKWAFPRKLMWGEGHQQRGACLLPRDSHSPYHFVSSPYRIRLRSNPGWVSGGWG